MSVIERGFYVGVGAFDLASEKLRELSVFRKAREALDFDNVRELEPRLRKQADELQARGEKAVKRAKTRVEDTRERVQKQVSGLRVRTRRSSDPSANGRAPKTKVTAG